MPPARHQHLQTFVLLGVLWLAAFGTQWFRIEKTLAGAERALGRRAEVAYVPPVPVLRMASLGHQSFVADLLFIRAAHYFVDHLVTDSRLPWLELYLDAIWGLDAHNRTTYRWGSQVIKFGQRIDRDVAERANRFARLGLEQFPDDPWLFHEIAFNLRYSMQPKDAAEESALVDLALRYLEIAYSFPSFNHDPNYLSAQYSRAGRQDDSVRAALLNYHGATEDQRRELRNLLRRRDKSGTASELAWYDLVHQRDWPYLPPGLALRVGPKRVLAPPLDSHAPEGWLREPPAPAELLKRLDIRKVVPPPGERLPAAETVDDPAPVPAPAPASGSAAPPTH